MRKNLQNTIALYIQNQKNAPGWRSLFYPPEWHHCKGWFTSQALTPIKIWVAAIPTIAMVESIVPVTIDTKEIKFIIGGSFEAPFNIQMSYFAALSYLLSYFLFQIFCPKFVAQNPAKFDIPPESITRTDIARVFRETLIKDMPRLNKMSSGMYLKKSTYGYFKVRDVNGKKQSAPSAEEARDAESILKKTANYTSRKLIEGESFPLRVSQPEKDFSEIFERDRGGSLSWKYESTELSLNLFHAVFAPEVKLQELANDKDFVATKTYNNLYFTLSESRSIARFFMSLFFYISVVAGLAVLFQIIFRGMRLLW